MANVSESARIIRCFRKITLTPKPSLKGRFNKIYKNNAKCQINGQFYLAITIRNNYEQAQFLFFV